MTADGPRIRTCAHCARPLPATSRSWRRFCSSRCRLRAWEASNRPTETAAGRNVPLHWHWAPEGERYPYAMLEGDGLTHPKRYWRGWACPPECRVPVAPGGFSIGVREGRGMGPEFPASHKRYITNDSWHPIADPRNYPGAPVPRQRRKPGELVRFDRARSR